MKKNTFFGSIVRIRGVKVIVDVCVVLFNFLLVEREFKKGSEISKRIQLKMTFCDSFETPISRSLKVIGHSTIFLQSHFTRICFFNG